MRRRLDRARRPDTTPIEKSRVARLTLGAVVLIYVIVVARWSLFRHYGFATFGFDLGIFDQGVWLLSQGKEPFVTVRGLNLFGDHTSFILWLMAPFYWIHATPGILLVSQTLAMGAGAVATFLMGREGLRNEVPAALLAVAYLAHPAVGWANFENFHPDTFEVPLLLFAFYLAMRKRWVPFALCIVGALLIKEDVALFTVGLGAYVALRYNKKVGLTTMGVSAAWLFANLFVILPAFNGAGAIYADRTAGHFGGVGGLLTTVVRRPWEAIGFALGPDKPWYLWQLLAPFALVPLMGTGALLIAALPLASNLLSDFAYQHQIQYHYTTLVIPALVVATVMGIARYTSAAARTRLATLVVVASLMTGYLWGPFGRNHIQVPDPDSSFATAAREALTYVPDDAVVSAHTSLVPHLTHRERIYEFPNPWSATNWGDASREGEELAIADEVEFLAVFDPETSLEEQEIVENLRSTSFDVVYQADGLLVMKRRE